MGIIILVFTKLSRDFCFFGIFSFTLAFTFAYGQDSKAVSRADVLGSITDLEAKAMTALQNGNTVQAGEMIDRILSMADAENLGAENDLSVLSH